ncbi:hypothetical protein [Natronosalvus vescus]|uniref:hypothetical protein n=1 Tax=Natronosalvus vescus TaxID=2953881 RepID=UPI00209166F2|nr:hypothetical protein [Natronosalvus vescus]
MNVPAGRILLIAVLLCVLPLAAGGGAIAAPTDSASGATASDLATVAITEENEEEGNDTARHQNPDEYGEDGSGAGSWLENYLAERLGDSAISISEGEYEFAKDFVGDEYRDRFDQYVEVAGETDEDSDDEDDDEKTTAEAYEEAADQQDELADRLETYEETKAEYEEAKSAGDEDRARELARELSILAENIATLSDDIRHNYEIIQFETETDLSDADTSINETNTRVQDEVETVIVETFVQTSLSVEADNETVSYLDPLSATGTLETADDSVIANQEIRLIVDGEPQSVETDEEGTFEFTYRPAPTTPLSTESVTVEYDPDATSTYFGSSAELNVSIDQVEPEIDSLETSENVAYGENLSVSASVLADGEPVDDAPVVVTLGGHALGELTVENGTVDDDIRVPAAVVDGEQPLRLALALEEQALTSATAETTVTVTETETVLTIDAEHTNETLEFEGTLETVDGDPIDGQPVTIQIDGEAVETVTTGADGDLSGAVPLPDNGDDDATVVAVFDGAETNLAGASAESVVPLTGSALPSVGEPGTPFLTWIAAIGGALLITLLVLGFWWRRRESSDTTEESPERPGDEDVPAETPTQPSIVPTLLSEASQRLSNGRTDAAVRASYAAVRRGIGRPDDGRSLTHWEFFTRYGGDERAEERDALQTMTETYERAAYTPETVSSGEATRALECARRLCTPDELSTQSGMPGDD